MDEGKVFIHSVMEYQGVWFKKDCVMIFMDVFVVLAVSCGGPERRRTLLSHILPANFRGRPGNERYSQCRANPHGIYL